MGKPSYPFRGVHIFGGSQDPDPYPYPPYPRVKPLGNSKPLINTIDPPYSLKPIQMKKLVQSAIMVFELFNHLALQVVI